MKGETPTLRRRRAVYSVTETARLCSLSRARFYDLIGDVMPLPVYCIRTRRPMYTADLAARCVEVRETNTAVDGRYIVFYERRKQTSAPPHGAPSSAAPASAKPRAAPQPLDPLTQEMIESLRAMGVSAAQTEIVQVIRHRWPQGPSEASFEADLLRLYGELRRPVGA